MMWDDYNGIYAAGKNAGYTRGYMAGAAQREKDILVIIRDAPRAAVDGRDLVVRTDIIRKVQHQ